MWCETVIGAAGEKPAARCAGGGGQAIPEPQRDGVAIADALETRAEPAAGEVRRAVFLVGGAEVRGPRAVEVECDAGLVGGVAALAGGVGRERAGEFVEPPVGVGFGVEQRAGGGAIGEFPRAAGAAGDFFEQADRGLGDFRLGLDLKPPPIREQLSDGSGRPAGVRRTGGRVT